MIIMADICMKTARRFGITAHYLCIYLAPDRREFYADVDEIGWGVIYAETM